MWDNISNCLENFVNILFEAQLEHLIGFIKNETLQTREVNVASLDVIEDSSCGSNKDIDTLSELSNLLVNINSTIYSHNFELIFIMLQFGHFRCDLESELSGGSKNDGLNLSCTKELVSSQVFHCWETESESLARTCQVSGNQVLSHIHWVE